MPIQYPDIWQMYKKAQASFWTAEEVVHVAVSLQGIKMGIEMFSYGMFPS